MLPPEEELSGRPNWTFDQTWYTVDIPSASETVPYGSWDIARVSYSDLGSNEGGYMYQFSYTKNIGPINLSSQSDILELINYDRPTENVTATPVSTPETPSVSIAEGCNNPYWPIIQGAWWKYYVEKYSAESNPVDHYHTHTITSVSQVGSIIYFNMQIVDGLDNSITNKSYYCNEKGVYDQVTDYLLLPTERELTEDYRWFQQNGQQMAVSFVENSLGLLKLPKTAYISYIDQNNWDYYALGIGPAGWAGGEHNLELADYYLPPVTQETPAPAANQCANPYWPITLGSSWAYDSNSGYVNEASTGIVRWEVIDLDMSSKSSTYFTIRESNSMTGEEKYSHYYCFNRWSLHI